MKGAFLVQNYLNDLSKGLMTHVLDLGEAMLKCGAEVSRVEDTLQRIFKSYGAADVDVLTITSCIILTVTVSDSSAYTQTRRIRASDTDFDRLSRLNALSRFICENRPSHGEIRFRLNEILYTGNKENSRRNIKKTVGTVFAAGGFAVFFGGSALDFAAAALVALFIMLFEKLFKKNDVNLPSYYFSCSLCAGMLTLLICALFSSVNSNIVMIGFIMIVIPGVAFTNSARDFLLGDTISGSLRMLESILYAACIAGGVALSLLLLGR